MITLFGQLISGAKSLASAVTGSNTSQARANNLVSKANTRQDVQTVSGTDDDFSTSRVVLRGKSGRSVIFEVPPSMGESRNVNYTEIGEGVRLPTSFLFYMGSSSRTFRLDSKFLSRTPQEADQTFRKIHLLKGWTVGDPNSQDLEINAPEVLLLAAYGNSLKNIPVVIRSLNIEYPDDVDYVSGGNGPMPIVQSVSISLTETHSIADIENFNLEQFKTGTLRGW